MQLFRCRFFESYFFSAPPLFCMHTYYDCVAVRSAVSASATTDANGGRHSSVSVCMLVSRLVTVRCLSYHRQRTLVTRKNLAVLQSSFTRTALCARDRVVNKAVDSCAADFSFLPLLCAFARAMLFAETTCPLF